MRLPGEEKEKENNILRINGWKLYKLDKSINLHIKKFNKL